MQNSTQFFTKSFLVVITMMGSYSINAKSYNWENITQQQYVDNLVSCETQLHEFKWSRNIWPKQNKKPKPAFSEIKDSKKIRKQVLDNLYKQNILSTKFNIEINQVMLQHDIDRMVQNTKDAKGLKAMFALFNNDPVTIAQCMSRPYLVKSKTQNSFNQDKIIHQETKQLAEQELKEYLQNPEVKSTNAQITKVNYKLISDDNDFGLNAQPIDTNEEIVIKLDKKQFQHKLLDLKNTTLHQKSSAFIYSEILEQNDNNILVKTLSWPKQTLNSWLSEQVLLIHAPSLIQNKIVLPHIKDADRLFGIKSGINTAYVWSRFISPGAPSARWRHTAVWSGNEMIVWGGNDSIALNTGGSYDPSTDSWLSTTTTNAPSARYLHTAVWSGSVMIIWGGNDGGALNTGGSYNPINDSWQQTNIIGAPIARYHHKTIWSGSEMIVWGGAGGSYLNSGGRYDPINDSWQDTNLLGAPSGRDYHTAIWSGNEMIVWGGYNGNSLLRTGGRYNPSTNSWIDINTIGSPCSSSQHTAVWSGSEMIVWGCAGFSGFGNTGGRYDPISDSWQSTSTTDAPIGRWYHTAVWDGSEMIIWGGYVGNPAGGDTKDGGQYDPINDSWRSTSTSNAPSARENHTAVWTGNEMIVWGGKDSIGLSLSMGIYHQDITYNIGVTVTGLDANNSIELTTNSQSLTFNSNTTMNFANQIDNGTAYAVLLTTQPIDPVQTCFITGGNSGNDDGSGTIVGSDVVISVDCNTQLTTVANNYTAFEDITLLANDADGSVTGVNNDGVLVNDSDIDGDTLMVVAPGTYTATGLGGIVSIAADGTFSYEPPANVSGQDVFNFNVTDGVHTVASSLTIDVLPVNDAPTFSILGNVLSAELNPDTVNKVLTIPMFAFDINAGANDESGQSLQFVPIIFADSNSVLVSNGVSMTSTGELTLNFTGNIGLAIIRIILLDDGSTTNGGDNTSASTELVVSYSDIAFEDSFEEQMVTKLFNQLKSLKFKSTLSNFPIYDENSNSLIYYGHKLKFDDAFLTPNIIALWLLEVEMAESKSFNTLN